MLQLLDVLQLLWLRARAAREPQGDPLIQGSHGASAWRSPRSGPVDNFLRICTADEFLRVSAAGNLLRVGAAGDSLRICTADEFLPISGSGRGTRGQAVGEDPCFDGPGREGGGWGANRWGVARIADAGWGLHDEVFGLGRVALPPMV
ncbi:hypothetical protein FHU37_000120 [Allostreptomyces psammosilenae]|uniref:Uncharacterized protein n=1 Tax=Allostreptomyces psammosilenae TaxID=1892865 RepID=A0A852ZNY9_9ACTN|nr:hypothetical protein [Allostreptomyces psammosilenae]